MRKFVGAVFVALVIAGALAVATIDLSLCPWLDPDSFLYRTLGCGDTAGGGGSGAGLP